MSHAVNKEYISSNMLRIHNGRVFVPRWDSHNAPGKFCRREYGNYISQMNARAEKGRCAK